MNAATALLFASLIPLSVLPNSCVAQERAPASKPPFVLEAGETKLADLIDRAAVFLQWNILSSPQETANGGPLPTVRLQQPIEVDGEGCEEVLAGLLYRSGFVLVPIDEPKRLYEVISMSGPRARDITMRAARRTPAEILARPSLAMPVTTAIQLKHINANYAANALRPFVASGMGQGNCNLTIGTAGGSTGLLISGMQDQVARLLRVLEACDVPQPDDPQMAPATGARLEAIERRLHALEQKTGTTTQQK